VYEAGLPSKGDPVSRSETLLRFAAPNHWDSLGSPTTAALSLKPAEDGVSAYLRVLLATRSLDAMSVIADRPGYGVLAIPVATALDADCSVEHDPIVRVPEKPIDFAHALVLRVRDKRRWTLVRAELLSSCEVLVAPEKQ
jgi:hypothetical protein